ncbi:MAG: pantoate--beta-alanine ligase [Ilumatobacteraceae bacterium]
MLICRNPDSMHMWSRAEHADGRRIGCVPTMGALHAGHLALIEEAARRCDVVVVTIFVNPLQFNRGDDFNKYPRPIDDDVEACRAMGVAAVYAPTADVMYPVGFDTHVEPGQLADSLEGASRPGHFRGVATVVAKLFGSIQPDVAVFGQKDFQQLAIIRRMVADLDMHVEVVALPTVREPDGLAISSRNRRLGPAERRASGCLSQALRLVADALSGGQHDSSQLLTIARERIAEEPLAKLDYVEIVDPATLAPLAAVDHQAVIVIASWFGDVRLIDNALLTL